MSKWCRRISKQCRPWSDCSFSMIWVYTVCLACLSKKLGTCSSFFISSSLFRSRCFTPGTPVSFSVYSLSRYDFSASITQFVVTTTGPGNMAKSILCVCQAPPKWPAKLWKSIIVLKFLTFQIFSLCWGFTAQSTAKVMLSRYFPDRIWVWQCVFNSFSHMQIISKENITLNM